MARHDADVTRRPLTPKQQRFVEEYLKDLCATAAYRRAGYAARGNSAEVSAGKLLRKPQVQAAITAAQAERTARVETSADEVLAELLTLMRSDVRHFDVGNDGRLTLAPGAPDRAWRAVSSVKHKIIPQAGTLPPIRQVEFRLWDKNAAIEKIAKHIGFYPPEKRELSGPGGGPMLVHVKHTIVDPQADAAR